MIDLPTNVLYVLDIILLIPALWFFGIMFGAAVTGRTAVYRIGSVFCWLGLVWLAATILRVLGKIA